MFNGFGHQKEEFELLVIEILKGLSRFIPQINQIMTEIVISFVWVKAKSGVGALC